MTKIWHNMDLHHNREYFTPSHNDGKVLQKDVPRACTFVPYEEESLLQLTKEDTELSEEQKTESLKIGRKRRIERE